MKRTKWESVLFECPQIDNHSRKECEAISVSARKKGAWVWHSQTYVANGNETVVRSDRFTVSHVCGFRLCDVRKRSEAIRLINKFHADGFGHVEITKDGVYPRWGDEKAIGYFINFATAFTTGTPIAGAREVKAK